MKSQRIAIVSAIACLLTSPAWAMWVSAMAAPTPHDMPDGVPVQDLLSATSTAFHQNGSVRPTRFRDVEVRLLDQPSGDQQYVLCGEFLPAEGLGLPPKWLSFATMIQPTPTHWTGADATGICQRAKMAGEKRDLSAPLQHSYGS